MNIDDFEGILAGYRQGATADVMQVMVHGKWGVYWALPPRDLLSAEQAAKQMRRMRPQAIRHGRRAGLRCADGQSRCVIIVTHLPERRQAVVDLITGEQISTSFISDEVLQIFERAFTLA